MIVNNIILLLKFTRILHNNFSDQNIALRNTNYKLSEISFKLSTNQDQNYELPVGT